MNIILFLGLLFVFFLAIALLAAWYGTWMYKRGYDSGSNDGHRCPLTQ